MKHRAQVACLGGLLLLAGLAGCVTLHRAGRAPEAQAALSFTHWWNFYQRGLARMDAGDWAGAAEDFERSLGLRPGATYGFPRESWRVRTYGLHFLKNYFPHRELGICRLRLDRFAEAERLLLESIGQEPSSRAHFHLNITRQRLLADQDLPPPVIETPADTVYSQRNDVALQASAKAEAYVAAYAFGQAWTDFELALSSAELGQTLVLPPGGHDVPIRVRDLKGQIQTHPLRVVIDQTAPAIFLDTPRREADTWHFKGLVLDTSGLRSLTLDGVSLLAAPTREVDLDLRLPPGAQGLLEAVDLAGNRLLLPLRDKTLAQLRREEPRWVASTGSARLPPPRPARFLDMEAADGLVVYEPRVFLDGSAQDAEGVTRVLIDGTDILPATDVSKPFVRFGHWLALGAETNGVEVSAWSGERLLERRRLTVLSKKPVFADPELHLAVTLSPFDNPRGVSPRHPLQDLLLDDFANRPPPFEPRFQVLARGEDLALALREWDLNLSALVDPRARIPYARISGSDLFLNGEIFAESGGYTLRLHTVNTADGIWLGSDDVYVDEGVADIASLLQGLVSKIERRFPVRRGTLARARGKEAILALSPTEKAPHGTRFLVIRPTEAAALENGRLLEWQGQRIELLVGDKEGRALILPAEGNKVVRDGDLLYAR